VPPTTDDSQFDIRELTGLTSEEAAARFAEYGPNEIAGAKKRTWWRVALDVVREPMLILLLGAGALYFVIGDAQEAALLLTFVFVVIGITFWQERKTENALEALRDLASPRALVVRDGVQTRIAGRDVVMGDIVLLAEGDRVPADGVLLDALSFSVDESLLTGESVPVRKRATVADAEMDKPGGDDTSSAFSATLAVKGQAIMLVKAVGSGTALGVIGGALSEVETERTPLQREVDRLVRIMAAIAISLCTVLVFGYALTNGPTDPAAWLEGLLAGITLAMAMLPEEFPVVLTVFLALGAWRISRVGVLTRRMPAVETLGSATVLATDKTGTLTQNRMTVRELRPLDDGVHRIADGDGELPEPMHEIVEYSILASPVDPFDPMDTAFKQLGERYLANTEHVHQDWRLVREYPLSEHLLALSHVWKSKTRDDYVIAAKGAPEAIADLCHLTPEECERIDATVSEMADEGLRVLGVARAHFAGDGELPPQQHDFDFEFMGLVGLEDPVREDVPQAVAQALAAGVRVVMITGDYPGTARAVAVEAGLRTREIMTGPELDATSDEELAARIGTIDIFARVVPEQKLRIVRALKDAGEVVAMTGDGVNDAPALKAAHIGIAMGQRGTDVAREAAALVLTEDDFSSMVASVRTGRRIFDNLRKAMAYILAVHVPIALMSILPVLLKLPLVLMPIHIAFLELIIDPACSVVFEAEHEEGDVMARPPRPVGAPMFSGRMVGTALSQGFVVFLAVAAVFMWATWQQLPETDIRTLTFVTLVLSNVGLILTNLSWSETIVATLRENNKALWWTVGGALAFLALMLYVPFLRDLFSFSFLHWTDIAIAVVVAFASILWFEVFKFLKRSFSKAKTA
jgi:Ca2+-transporting ATPase